MAKPIAERLTTKDQSLAPAPDGLLGTVNVGFVIVAAKSLSTAREAIVVGRRDDEFVTWHAWRDSGDRRWSYAWGHYFSAPGRARDNQTAAFADAANR